MLITCPRCGFNQPKDRYCAQCGLDIQNYNPPKKSLFQKLADATVFQIILVFLIALVSGFYIYKNNRNELKDRVQFFSQGIQYSRSAGTPPPPQPGPPPAAMDTAPPPPQASAPPPEAVENMAKSGAAKSAEGFKINIQYAEIPRRVLTDVIFSESRQSGQFNSLGDHISGIWPQGKKKIANLKGLRWLGKETKKIEVGRTIQLFAGIHGSEPENDLGLTTYVEIGEVDANNLAGNLEIVRSWQELNAENPGPVQRRFFPAVIELPIESIFFLAGALPRDSAMSRDAELTNADPFKVLKANTFRSGETEFVIFVDFEK